VAPGRTGDGSNSVLTWTPGMISADGTGTSGYVALRPVRSRRVSLVAGSDGTCSVGITLMHPLRPARCALGGPTIARPASPQRRPPVRSNRRTAACVVSLDPGPLRAGPHRVERQGGARARSASLQKEDRGLPDRSRGPPCAQHRRPKVYAPPLRTPSGLPVDSSLPR
jgi:hypothetical protein